MLSFTICGGFCMPWLWTGDACIARASPTAVDSADAAKRREFIIGLLVVACLGSRPTTQGSIGRAGTLRSVEKNFRRPAVGRHSPPCLRSAQAVRGTVPRPLESEFDALAT